MVNRSTDPGQSAGSLDAKRAQREFKLLMDESGATQRDVSELLGVNLMTVNRWCTDREDGFPVPFYALQFMRVYIMLPDAARIRLPRKTKEAAGASPKPPMAKRKSGQDPV